MNDKIDNLVNEFLDYGIAYCHATCDEESLSIWDHLKSRVTAHDDAIRRECEIKIKRLSKKLPDRNLSSYQEGYNDALDDSMYAITGKE